MAHALLSSFPSLSSLPFSTTTDNGPRTTALLPLPFLPSLLYHHRQWPTHCCPPSPPFPPFPSLPPQTMAHALLASFPSLSSLPFSTTTDNGPRTTALLPLPFLPSLLYHHRQWPTPYWPPSPPFPPFPSLPPQTMAHALLASFPSLSSLPFSTTTDNGPRPTALLPLPFLPSLLYHHRQWPTPYCPPSPPFPPFPSLPPQTMAHALLPSFPSLSSLPFSTTTDNGPRPTALLPLPFLPSLLYHHRQWPTPYCPPSPPFPPFPSLPPQTMAHALLPSFPSLSSLPFSTTTDNGPRTAVFLIMSGYTGLRGKGR
ncbi:hypothetical protein ACOMHN_037111 [Nucella lapillus]